MDHILELSNVRSGDAGNEEKNLDAKFIFQKQQISQMRDTHGSQLERLARNKVKFLLFCFVLIYRKGKTKGLTNGIN